MHRLLPLLLLIAPLQAELSFESADGGLSVEDDGKILFIYRTDQRIPCLYPLYGPTGTNLTRHFPFRDEVEGEEHDHPHHLSFWMAHGDVNGVDFWHGKDTRIRHEGFAAGPDVEKGAGHEELTFTADLTWRTTPEAAPLLTEKRTYWFLKQADTFTIDVTCVLTATDQDVVFGDTKEGTFAFRVTPTLRLKGEVAQGQILNAEGLENDAAWGKRSKWVAYHGPDSAAKPVVVALMDHPKNLRHPTWWHARDYGLIAANPFGQHDFEGLKDQPEIGDHTLKAGKSLTQRYRLVMHAGELESIDLGESFAGFSR